MRLTSLHDWLLFLHVLAAVVSIGGLAALNVLGTSAVRRGEPDGVARFVASLRVAGPIVLGPRRWWCSLWLILLLLVIATWDMVFKPGL